MAIDHRAHPIFEPHGPLYPGKSAGKIENLLSRKSIFGAFYEIIYFSDFYSILDQYCFVRDGQ